MTAGAIPKVTKSAKLSNCFPYSLSTFKILAIFPSRKSNKIPIRINQEHKVKFDSIQVGEPFEYRFEFVNSGMNDLVIKDLAVPCGCTKANYERKLISPGDTGFVEIIFTPFVAKEKEFKYLVVKTNAYPISNHQLMIAGKVIN